MIEIKEITNSLEWEKYSGDWNALLSISSSNHIFLTYEWLSTWWEIFGNEKGLGILLAFDGTQLKGIAPLYINKERVFKVLRFIGSRVVPADFLNFIVESGREPEIIPAFMNHLFREIHWDKMFLSDMKDEPNTITSLKNWLTNHHCPFSLEKHYPCPSVEIPGTMEGFLAKVDPIFLGGLKKSRPRQLHRLLRDHQVEFHSSVGQNEYRRTLEKLFLLHEERWQLEKKVGQFHNPHRKEFYKRISKKMLEKNWLRLASLKVDGNEEAVLLGIAYSDDYYYLQIGCGLRGRQLKAGNVLFYYIFESIIGQIKTFNFLRGKDAYKYKWGAVDTFTVLLTSWKGWKGKVQYMVNRLRKPSMRIFWGD